jgi:DNA-binding transcriptional LysR family regulator
VPDVELRLLRYFVAVAEDLHFGHAAIRLHIAQPALSQAIAKLEQQIGFPLLTRTNRRVELTEAGSVLLERAKRTLADAEDAITAARRAHRGETGRLRIGFTETVLYGLLPAVLRVYRAEWPDVELTLVRMDGGDQLETLLRGDVHVVFGRRELSDDRVAVCSLRWDSLWLVLPRDHRLGPSASVALEAVAGEPFVFPTRAASPATYDTMLGLCRSAGFSPHIAYDVDRIDLVPAYVAANLGVGLVPDYFSAGGEHLACFRPVAELPAWLELALTHLVGTQVAVLSGFIDIATRVAKMRWLSPLGSPGVAAAMPSQIRHPWLEQSILSRPVDRHGNN